MNRKASFYFTRLFYINLIVISTSNLITAQTVFTGKPEIVNYSKILYAGGTQNWAITTGSNNELLVANNDGVLVFNGHNWKKFYLPNKTIVRSVAYDSFTGRIYAGGQDEFGYYEADIKGNLVFTSLISEIPESYRQLEDVWDIIIRDGSLYFRSLNRLYIFKGNKWKVFEYKDRVFSLSILNEKIVYHVLGKGLFSLLNGEVEFLTGSEIFADIPVVSITDLSVDRWFIFTEKEGIYSFQGGRFYFLNNELSNYLKKNLVHSASRISMDYIAVGTYLNGLIIMDNDAGLKYVLNKSDGLLNNTVSSLYSDTHGQVWAGTYNGISCIKLNSPYSLFFPDGTLSGAVYDIEIFDGKIYCGTENGLYYKEIKSPTSNRDYSEFRLVNGSEGQVWGLDVIHGNLIMSHNDGAFTVQGNNVRKIGKSKGAWKFIEWNLENLAVGGYYDGLYFFEKINGQWVQKERIGNFNESSRIIVRRGNDIWVAHPYRGLFRISIDRDNKTSKIQTYGINEGLPNRFRNHIFVLHDHVLVATESGIFKYEDSKNVFVRLNVFDKYFTPETEFKRLFSEGDYVWFVTDKETGYLRIKDNIIDVDSEKKTLYGITQRLVAGFENLLPLSNGNAMIMTNNGVVYYRPILEKTVKLSAYISSIRSLKSDSIVYNSYAKCAEEEKGSKCNFGVFDNINNAFEFEFSSGSLESPVYYRYKMQSINKDWSDWSTRNFKEYNNIPHGKHTFVLQAKDIYGNESTPVYYNFRILPPWYLSGWAYGLYLIVIGLSLWFARMRIIKKFETETTRLEAEIKESDAKVEQLINEKLEAEILFKTKELGLSTMHLMKKNETISKLRQELEKLRNVNNDVNIRQEIKSLISILSEDERLDDDWNSFAKNFDLIHNDFLKRMKQRHPNLTARDLKLCAYLKMNLSTKELAPLLNISVRGVEISRYRLRKKLGIPNDYNLTDYMMEV